MNPDPQILVQLVTMPMPFGKYKGTLLCNLPVSYLAQRLPGRQTWHVAAYNL
jgi:uncharacterized protein (DUF3820 family)